MIAELLTVISPVAICALLGFAWAKMGHSVHVEDITRLVTNIGTPALVFSTLTAVEISNTAFTEMAIATVLTIVLFAVAGGIILKICRMELRPYLPPMIWANMGNMGLPLCLFAFGAEGLALAITYFTVDVIMLFTFGVAFSAGAFSIRRVLQLPFIYAVAIALFFMIGDIEVPRWLASTSDLLGGLTIPLMLIMLGISLAELKVSQMKRTTALSALRLVMGFAVGLLVAEVLGMEGIARGVLILQAAMPVAIYNYLFAVRYEQKPDEVAGMIVVSTALSFVTLPALLWYLL